MGKLIEPKINPRTKSFSFILPMIGESISQFIDLVNCYVRDIDRPELTNHIFVLFKYGVTKEFSRFEDQLTRHHLYCESYDPDPNHVMFVFHVPLDFQMEYDLFTNPRPGKCYSLFSDGYKQHIMKFLEAKVDVSLIQEILYRHEVRYLRLEKTLGQKIPRTVENYDLPDIENETYIKPI